MNLMQQPLLSILLTVGLGTAFLIGKLIEYMTAYKETRPDGTVIKREGVDLELFIWVTGFGAFMAFIWMLQVLGVFSS